MTVVEFDPPERFVLGTVGPAGQRTFFLQASDGTRRVQIALEKLHAQVLAERIGELLDQVAGREATIAAAAAAADNAPLDTPISEDFRVSALALSWDDDRHVVVIEAHDHDPDEIDELDVTQERSTLRVWLPPAQARAFARRCETVVRAGRPPCPFCGGPVDEGGHICPRANGYKR
ncbi:DUF3090 domain-containing protein [Janibacter limosus]|jgi:uncharacterized repeat protein (TIGR03847 family)|uniref:DUF3090 domain-containing protein n=1 Tax=Janibacter limosus TaxID=53458 RepID=A0A4P6MWX0_9MICO|nr:DUF3090 domain-containing protein [Janibacter limosus]QBF46080.1 DUF3090 domain-containing protein [Janibacter limosus]